MRLQLSERDEFLSELFEKRGFVSFNESTNNIIKFDTHAYNLKEFNQDFLKIKTWRCKVGIYIYRKS